MCWPRWERFDRSRLGNRPRPGLAGSSCALARSCGDKTDSGRQPCNRLY
ncbi:hypothetical protein AK973_4362 [Pseudomonas brassicacearum]|nr:hypothetical protein AK973_4362 [Pseudomonas brassicacearum]